MRLKLFHKLFLVLVGTSVLSLVLFASFAHWYAQRSFLRYLNDEREARLAVLSEQLLAVHARDGDWHALRDDPRAWRQLLREAIRAPRQTEDRPPPPDELGGERPPPRHDLSPFHAHRGPPPHGARDGKPRPLFGAGPHVDATLYDTDYKIIAGPLPYRRDLRLHAVSRDGRTLAYVGVPPLRNPADARDVRFARRLARMVLGGALVAGVLSLLVAAWLARRQSRPIIELGAGARALASGHFGTRLAPQGSDEIGALVDDFNVLARTLEDNESARRRWFADVSHELRTPLAIMRGELEAASDGIRPINAALVESLGQETARLAHLVDDLYQLARADIGALDYEFARASLGALLTESISHFARRWQQSGIHYDYDIDADLCAHVDSRRILQLFENLFENSTRYTDAPGHLEITARRVNGAAQLIIADSGPGVADDELGQLFEPLYRAEKSRGRAHGGSGLGLAICKRIVAAHGGHIEARRSALGGVAIHVQLPLVQ
ncbi:MAG: HAMP domain-containing protein [Proteobacteria bacterium]|jgi:two-component system sensor histidine kinase BaeS|nr:HAMP domain-containing protein [Pseudomonadota bacterium]